MQNNRTTAVENDPPDTEDWELALGPYEGDPDAALQLGYNLMVLKHYLAVEPLRIHDAIVGLDRGFEALFLYTRFREVSYVLFRRLAEGKLTVEEEKVLKLLGIKF